MIDHRKLSALLQGEISNWPEAELCGFICAALQILGNEKLDTVIVVARAMRLQQALSGPLVRMFPGNIQAEGWPYPYEKV